MDDKGFKIPLQWLIDALLDAAIAKIALRDIAKNCEVKRAELEFALQQARLQVGKLPQVSALRRTESASGSELATLRSILQSLEKL